MNAKGVRSFSPGLRDRATPGTSPANPNPERVSSAPHSGTSFLFSLRPRQNRPETEIKRCQRATTPAPKVSQPATPCSHTPNRTPSRPIGHRPSAIGNFVALALLLLPGILRAQPSPHIPQGSQLQLQVAQPRVDVSSPVTATAMFDPPVAHPGETVLYRVSVDATESSIAWPPALPAPAELKFGPKRSGQITLMQGGGFRPIASFVYETTAPAEGQYTVANFNVDVAGAAVMVPAARLEVTTNNFARPPGRRVVLQPSATNVFLGQPFHVRVMLPAGPANEIEALREIELRGDGLMVDKTPSRQVIERVTLDGQEKQAFTCELTVTPIAAGPLTFTAQGFTSGRDFGGSITIRGQVSLPGGPPQYLLLISKPVTIHVRPLPEGELPGFTGAIGKFSHDPPRLGTNRLHLGEPVQLDLTFHGEGDLTRFVPPAAPVSRDWQVIANPPPATSFTLIPLTDEAQATPAIPLSYFDPETAKYVDLTIPPLPVTVVGEGLPLEAPAAEAGEKSEARLRLSSLAPAPGKVGNLQPLQLQSWFIGVQLLPLAGLLALWQWDRRRRYLEAHPEIVRRAQARRALRREKRQLQQAAAAGDLPAYVRHATQAMNIAVAPHFPADPRALVSADVLAHLDPTAQNGPAAETVRQIFAAADAQYAAQPPTSPLQLPKLTAGVESVLQQLEEKL